MEVQTETVYGTPPEGTHVVMSEKVQALANSIYQEFERMMSSYDDDVVKDLMPLVVNVLECLDLSFTENQEHEVELELIKEDNEQLVTQYEREKQLRKTAEQKYFEVEDAVETEQKELQAKVESLESILRMMELKGKNAADHVTRLEDREQELKREYGTLHERYTELFKTHVDYMERTKILFGTDRLEYFSQFRAQKGSVRGGLSRGAGSFTASALNSLETPAGIESIGTPSMDFASIASSHVRSNEAPTSLRSEIQDMQSPLSDTDKAGSVKGVNWHDASKQDTPDLEDGDYTSKLGSGENRVQNRPNTLYQELCFQDSDLLGDGDDAVNDATDSDTEAEANRMSARSDINDNFFGMGKEVENLILENNELLATKNALNIVKDDLIAKVDELTSENELCRQEIRSLGAVRSRLQLRVQELEEEVRRIKEELDSQTKGPKDGETNDEEEVPMAQRKRFTRLEMARVLMERNQYKERFMELQEAVRWTEMIRASKGGGGSAGSGATGENGTGPDGKKGKSTIWKLFNSLFGSSPVPPAGHATGMDIRYGAATHHVSPALDTMRRKTMADKRKAVDFIDREIDSEKLQQQRAKERREQYKQVRAHVKKEDGRVQAYGWSLPVKVPGQPSAVEGSNPSDADQVTSPSAKSSSVPVPVPVYCRPLMEREPGMKIWCAAGVNLTGGRTRDGGSIVGASVFYGTDDVDTNMARSECSESGLESSTDVPGVESPEVERLHKELMESRNNRIEFEEQDRQLSSYVWICASMKSTSKVTVIDANNPVDILESFHVGNSHLLCIASVPGAKESDYPVDDELNRVLVDSSQAHPSTETRSSEDGEKTDVGTDGDRPQSDNKIGGLTFINCATGAGGVASRRGEDSLGSSPGNLKFSHQPESLLESLMPDLPFAEPPGSGGVLRRINMAEQNSIVKDGVSEIPRDNQAQVETVEKTSSVMPTIWMGSQSGYIYVHSAVTQWKRCLHSVRLRDSVLAIVHLKGRILAALADGTVAIFHRSQDGQWDLSNYHLLDLGKPHHSIRCMTVVHSKVWCGYRNKIHVVDPQMMTVEASFDAHPRRESQVRQLAWVGDGVWVSIRLDSTLRLYHAHTFKHLQDVDIEPYVSKMLGTGKLGFSFVRITALLISCNRLWMGTGNGVVISVPLSDNASSAGACSAGFGGAGVRGPGGAVKVYADNRAQVTSGSFIPYCNMAHAQLSFHGHRDCVRFFVSVPGTGGIGSAASTASGMSSPTGGSTSDDKSGRLGGAEGRYDKDSGVLLGGRARGPPQSMLIISGGEGYIDFRIGEGAEDDDRDTRQPSFDDDTDDQSEASTVTSSPLHRKPKASELSHLIVWKLELPTGDKRLH